MNDKQFKEMVQQARFCEELMKRLLQQIYESKLDYGAIQKHTRMQADITRIRRELLELTKMLNTFLDTV